jgi:peptidoglycan-associated lipoprotein
VRAGRSDPGADWPACQAPPHLERARVLLTAVGGRPGRYVARKPDLGGRRPASRPAAERIPSAVHFALHSDWLHPVSRQMLDRVARAMLLDRRLTVVLDGYADERGTDRANVGLSRRRARAVYDHLVAAGVHRSRMTIRAHGETPARDPRSRLRGFALARNVTLRVRTPDGGRLPVDERPLDLQLERRGRRR